MKTYDLNIQIGHNIVPYNDELIKKYSDRLRRKANMNDTLAKRTGEAFIDLQESLTDSVRKAGGDPAQFEYSKIKDITVGDLYNRIATNKIRFEHIGPIMEREERNAT